MIKRSIGITLALAFVSFLSSQATALDTCSPAGANVVEKICFPAVDNVTEILVEKIQANTVERWGVQQSEIVITYRFSQPNEPAALVLPVLTPTTHG